MKQKYILLLLAVIILLGFLFRFSFLNWDMGYHMHPDERAIILFTTPLHLPSSLHEFYSPKSPWNPHFFAYGSLPLYLLWLAGQAFKYLNPLFADYALLNIVGRGISALFDTGTIFLLYLVTKRLTDRKTALLAAFLYAISVLPIQLSHYYAVDTLLTFFVFATLYCAIHFYEKPTIKNSILIGLFFGFALATKVSAVVLAVPIFITLSLDFLLVFFKQPHKPHIWFPRLSAFLKHLCTEGLIIVLITFLVYYICEPYALIDFPSFHQQTLDQSAMTKNAFVFPYTLQYVGKIPYIYELKNVFFFGLGPLISIFAFVGILYATGKMVLRREKSWRKEALLLSFFWIYFLIVGHFAIGFMRYMLPLYPLFCLFGAKVMQGSIRFLIHRFSKKIIFVPIIAIFLTLIWPLSFMHIYTVPNTRIQATNYILTHIPEGSKIALEHWDDAVPITGQERYTLLTLPLYDPDTPQKWIRVNNTLLQTDYIILASNRLYVPLQKLTDCEKLPPGRCYPITAKYYKNLFSGKNVLFSSKEKAIFEQIAVFSDPPVIPFLHLRINDQSADESFTVYDHPKIFIFKKIQ